MTLNTAYTSVIYDSDIPGSHKALITKSEGYLGAGEASMAYVVIIKQADVTLDFTAGETLANCWANVQVLRDHCKGFQGSRIPCAMFRVLGPDGSRAQGSRVSFSGF
jgi:hypothetical protein